MDRLQAMAVFVAVAEEAGFAPAARRLNLSPPSVTRAVAALEARLGARLLHRTTRAVSLSEAGERYLADCRRILAEIEEAERQAAGDHAAPRGPVALTAPVMFGRIVVTPVLLDLMDRYAGITLTTLFVDRIAHMLDEGLDVAVRIAALPDSTLTAVRVGSVRRQICAAPAYLARHGRPRDIADLAGHRLIDHTNMSVGGEWRFGARGTEIFRPQARLRMNSADAAIAAAIAGRGITRVLSYQVRAEIAAGTLETVLDDRAPAAVPVHVVHKEAARTSARVRAVVDFLVPALRASPALEHGPVS